MYNIKVIKRMLASIITAEITYLKDIMGMGMGMGGQLHVQYQSDKKNACFNYYCRNYIFEGHHGNGNGNGGSTACTISK